MAIPTFEEVMLPVLVTIKDKNEHPMKDVRESVSNYLKLTDEEKNRLLSSGKITYMYDRVGWAKTYMKFAGLIQQSGRGTIKITENGLNVLNENPTKIDVEYLNRFPEFVEWKSKKSEDKHKDQSVSISSQTPEDMMLQGHEIIQDALYSDLLDKVKSVSDQGFEMLILDLCKKMNYGDLTEHTGKVGDQGIDGIIKEDRLGLGEIYLQAKRWEGQVSSKDVRNFAGSLQATKTKKGIFITTSDFSSDGKNWIETLKDTVIILINGKQLAKLMVEFNVGVSIINNIEIKKIEQDYFEQFL